MSAEDFSAEELAFIERMKPHCEAGLSVEKAAAAVLADDERLFLAAHDRDTGPAIREEMARQVYGRIRNERAAA